MTRPPGGHRHALLDLCDQLEAVVADLLHGGTVPDDPGEQDHLDNDHDREGSDRGVGRGGDLDRPAIPVRRPRGPGAA